MVREYIGIDLHTAFFRVCAIAVTGERLWEARFPRTVEGIARFIARGIGPAQAIAVAASGPTWTFVDALQPTGVRIVGVDSRKTKLKAGYAAKTDRLDARRLADALRRESVVGIYIPPPAIRELREVCRGRHHVVRVRTRLAQAMRALLLRCNAGEPPTATLHTARALAWLSAQQLPPDADRALRRLERLYRTVHAEAQAADQEVRQRAEMDVIAQGLERMAGVGPIRALTLRAEIGDIARFADGPALACYAGLVPRVDASAGRIYRGRITRDGSRWLRWILVEIAVHAIRRDDARARWARRLAVRKGIQTARVALARVLCDEGVATWRTSRMG